MTDPAIISVAPNGARKTKADHPALPIAPADLAATAAACTDAGASLIHLHVRDGAEKHTLDADAYGKAIAAVREAVGGRMIVQMTTEAVGIYTPVQQMEAVKAVMPEAASVAMKEIVPDASKEEDGAAFYAWAAGEGIHLQHILYSGAEVTRFGDLVSRGVIPGQGHTVLYVLGRYTQGQQSSPDDIDPFLEAARMLPEGVLGPWFVCAFGAQEAACVGRAIQLGGHARVGFENNMLLPDGSTAPDNAALVQEAVKAANDAGRSPATADEARRLLGIAV